MVVGGLRGWCGCLIWLLFAVGGCFVWFVVVSCAAGGFGLLGCLLLLVAGSG